jgi:LuxR family transcriptional regulator, maltose regulon positive regulatory protein
LESVRNLHLALRVKTQLATVRFRAKQVAEALASFGGIVTTFARAGVYQTVLEGALKLGLEPIKGSRELMPYVPNLISARSSRYQSEPQQAQTSAIAESLSAREGDILMFIGQGLSNKEIARNLAIDLKPSSRT